MIALLQQILILGAALLAGLLGLGTPHQAIAPVTTVPAPVVTKAPTSTAPSTPTPETVKPKPAATTTPKTPPPPTPIPITSTPEYQDALQKALDALAKAQAASSSAPASPLNETVRSAVVNILCTLNRGSTISEITASGVMVDPRGIILTNAHVGQYLLLKGYPSPGATGCVVRTGSPARPGYTAQLLYLPPSWMAANASKIKDPNPTGNGEHDYALIVLTGVTGPSVPIPDAFPYLPIGSADLVSGDSVLIAGYAAGLLGGITIEKDLYISSATARIGEVYTYNTNTPDLVSLGGSVVSQRGSSGGAVADQGGTLRGLVVTSTDAPETAGRDLRALTTSYIARDFMAETGLPLSSYLAGDILKEAGIFMTTIAPTLTKELTDVLNQ